MQELGKLFVTVLAISNPLGNLAIFISMAARSAPQQILDCLRTMTIALFCIFAISAVFGNAILSLFGISISALQCAGGLLLLKIGLSMIGGSVDNSHKSVDHDNVKPRKKASDKDDELASQAVIPLALPLLGGPGAISAIILYASSHVHEASFTNLLQLGSILLTLLVICLIIYVVFRVGISVKALHNPEVASIMTKVMGLLIMSIAVDMVLTGLKTYLF